MYERQTDRERGTERERENTRMCRHPALTGVRLLGVLFTSCHMCTYINICNFLYMEWNIIHTIHTPLGKGYSLTQSSRR